MVVMVEVIGPLLSRSRVFTLKPLVPEHVRTLLERALHDAEHGHVFVVDGDEPPHVLGVLTELDLLRRWEGSIGKPLGPEA